MRPSSTNYPFPEWCTSRSFRRTVVSVIGKKEDPYHTRRLAPEPRGRNLRDPSHVSRRFTNDDPGNPPPR